MVYRGAQLGNLYTKYPWMYPRETVVDLEVCIASIRPFLAYQPYQIGILARHYENFRVT